MKKKKKINAFSSTTTTTHALPSEREDFFSFP
jgi:hypothetical protein